MQREKVTIVDENDRILGYKWRDELTTDDRWRITSIWLVNSHGQVLIAQRDASKKNHPNMWGPSAAGTVEASETYESNAAKELEEELGLQNTELKLLSRGVMDTSDGTKRYMSWFVTKCDWPAERFTPQPGEVQAVKWVDKDWLLEDIKANPNNYTPSCISWPELFAKLKPQS